MWLVQDLFITFSHGTISFFPGDNISSYSLMKTGGARDQTLCMLGKDPSTPTLMLSNHRISIYNT